MSSDEWLVASSAGVFALVSCVIVVVVETIAAKSIEYVDVIHIEGFRVRVLVWVGCAIVLNNSFLINMYSLTVMAKSMNEGRITGQIFDITVVIIRLKV